MNIPASFQALRVNVTGGETKRNKSQSHYLPQPGDNNANQRAEDEGETGLVPGDTGPTTCSIPPLVSQGNTQDKLLIWGTGQQCVEPDLRELEPLKSQKMHSFLGNRREREEEEEDDEGSLRDWKDEGPMSISSSSTASSASLSARRNDNDSNRLTGSVQKGKEMQRRAVCYSSEDLDACAADSKDAGHTGPSRGRERERHKGGLKESKSETNVFVSSLSAISLSGSLASSLDSSGGSPKTNFYPTSNPTTSTITRRKVHSLESNRITTPSNLQQQQELQGHLQYSQAYRQDDGGHHRNGSSSIDGGFSQRARGSFEERVLPPRRQQLVRPLCQTETARSRTLVEPMATSPQTAAGQLLSTSPSLPADPQCQWTNRKYVKTSLREPSDVSHLYSAQAVLQPRLPRPAVVKDAAPQPGSLQASNQCTSSPSNPASSEKRPQTQLTYRRNCSSPNRTGIVSRTSTPPHSPLRTPQGSPRRQASMFLVSRNVTGIVRHPQAACSPAIETSPKGYSGSGLRQPVKTSISTTGLPKAPVNNQQSPPNSNHNSTSPKETISPSYAPKPKGVRPKIITYVRKNPQVRPQAMDGPYQVSSLPPRLSAYPYNQANSASTLKDTPKDTPKPGIAPRGGAVLNAPNLLYERYRQEVQSNIFPPGMKSMRAPVHTHPVPPAYVHTAPQTHTHSHASPPKLASKPNNFYGTLNDKYMPSESARMASFGGSPAEDPKMTVQSGGSGSLLRSGRGLRLGLGAVTRTTVGSSKDRGSSQVQRSNLVFSQPVQAVSPENTQKDQEDKEVHGSAGPAPSPGPAQPQAPASRSLLPKAASQSGLRPPGFSSSRLPTGRLAAFGFVRRSSVSPASSASSAPLGDSTHSDPCRTVQRVSVSEDPPLHRVTSTNPPSEEHHREVPCRATSLQPPSTPALPRRYLPAQPRNSPGVGRKDFQRSSEVTRSLPSSPKRLAVVPPKPQSPVQSRQRPAVAVRGSVPLGSPRRIAPFRPQQEQQENLQREKEEAQQKEREKEVQEREKEEQRGEVQRLQERCEQQEGQLRMLRKELRRNTLGLEAFIITTRHYCLKNDNTEERGREISVEIQRIRDELACNSVRWERLQQDKMALEVAFEQELQELQLQQEAELTAVEEGLRKCHSAETEHLRAEHRSEVEELSTQQQELMEEMAVNHQAAVQELRDMHNITMATLHEEHARTMRDLRRAHEQQKLLLEEEFEKLRLCLQDQVDTLTFQNQSLRDKAKRFEEALRRSTDEQIIEALVPYQHIEEDLKSLKEVVEMKNQQIHQQEIKISDLEKVAQKNILLQEMVQVLQQQNEDLKARIEKNLVLSRQLSEENSSLQVSVEKECSEKKRLSRNNEELLWRLQTSPLMSPCSSPLHRSFSTSPLPSSSPIVGYDSPTHCYGCLHSANSPVHRANQILSPGPATPTHRAATNQNLSPGPTTPTHRAATNLNYFPGPATPTHRASATHCSSAAYFSSLQK